MRQCWRLVGGTQKRVRDGYMNPRCGPWFEAPSSKCVERRMVQNDAAAALHDYDISYSACRWIDGQHYLSRSCYSLAAGFVRIHRARRVHHHTFHGTEGRSRTSHEGRQLCGLARANRPASEVLLRESVLIGTKLFCRWRHHRLFRRYRLRFLIDYVDVSFRWAETDKFRAL